MKNRLIYIVLILFFANLAALPVAAKPAIGPQPGGLDSIFCKGPGGSSGGNDWSSQKVHQALAFAIELSVLENNRALEQELRYTKISIQPTVPLGVVCPPPTYPDLQARGSTLQLNLHNEGFSSYGFAEWVIYVLDQLKNQQIIDEKSETALINQLNIVSRSFSL